MLIISTSVTWVAGCQAHSREALDVTGMLLSPCTRRDTHLACRRRRIRSGVFPRSRSWPISRTYPASVVMGTMVAEGGEGVSVLALSDTLERRVSPCHCVTENYVVMSELRHALNDTSLARRMTQESWSQDAPSGSRFALGLPLPRLSSPLSLSRSSSPFIP